MPQIYDSVRRHEVAPEIINRQLRSIFDPKRPMGNFAQSALSDVISVWLAGYDAEIAPVVPRSLEWLDIAIAGDERFGSAPNTHRLTLHRAKALGLWMRDGINATSIWDQARQFYEAALAVDPNFWTGGLRATEGLDDYMALCFQAEQYETGIAEYEKHVGIKAFTLKLGMSPRKLGYALCRHKARGDFEPDDLLAAGRKMLQGKLEGRWLWGGQYIRAATWLKIVYWHHDPTLTPRQAVLKAYDDMPKVPRPDFI